MEIACYGILFASSAVLVLIFVLLRISLQRLRIRRSDMVSSDIPTISLCIPARNEKHALSECLERVLASDYPKLEVLVLDDNSQDDTSIIIKSFAHAGVRFIPGKPLPRGWLGRNYALDTLAREASGTHVVFMDVDTHITPRTISQLVGYGQSEKKDMISVIPRRYDTYRANVLFGTLRYFWQCIFGQIGRVTASGSLWMIKRNLLLGLLDRISEFKRSVEPESALARSGITYNCIISDEVLGVGYEKRWKSQLKTSQRLLYPLFGKNILGFIGGFLLFLLLSAPILFVVAGVFGWNDIHTIGAVILLGYGTVYAFYLKAVWVKRWWLGIVLWPYVSLQEFILFIASAWGYGFKNITWKDRSIYTGMEETKA
ncbi:MAG TPA: glycosyltransferase family 2 protein [Candidatus Saccharimonadales bacterium]|nr:glycosyltransferase family 2 protein [Candidatus Saccharimonadales bacterium]